MDVSQPLKKHAVARHRVINPRSEHGHDIESAENRDGDERRNPCRGRIAEQRGRRDFGNPGRAFHLGHRHAVDINHVDRQVERDHDQVSHQQRLG